MENLNYKILTSVSQHKSLKPKLKILFKDCYGHDLDDELYKQYYIISPFGETISLVALNHKNNLVGHYALLPMLAVNKEYEEIKYYLGITLAIRKKYSSLGILPNFFSLAKKIMSEKKIDLILGFPNKNSFLLLKTFYNWDIVYESPFFSFSISLFKKKEKVKLSIKENFPLFNQFSPPYNNKEYFKWRSIRSKIKIYNINDKLTIIGKFHKGNYFDVLDLHEFGENDHELIGGFLTGIGADGINITELHAKKIGLVIPINYERNDIVRMGLMSLNNTITNNKFRFSLMFSDVY